MKIFGNQVIITDDEEYLAYQRVKSQPGEAKDAHHYLIGDFTYFFRQYISPGRDDDEVKILDAGCREGFLCTLYPSTVTGVELVPEVATYAQSLGRRVVQGDLDKLHHSEEVYNTRWNGIFCSHALEHCRHPDEVFKAFFLTLKPRGYVYIVVPCVDKPVEKQRCHIWSWTDLKQLMSLFEDYCFEVVEFKKRVFRGSEMLLILRKRH